LHLKLAAEQIGPFRHSGQPKAALTRLSGASSGSKPPAIVLDGQHRSLIRPLNANGRFRRVCIGRVEEFAKDSVDAAYAGAPPVFDGYVVRMLTSQGDGFTVIASPVKYGDSGIMTFILGRDGMVQQKDLGPSTSQLTASIDSYRPDEGWTPAE